MMIISMGCTRTGGHCREMFAHLYTPPLSRNIFSLAYLLQPLDSRAVSVGKREMLYQLTSLGTGYLHHITSHRVSHSIWGTRWKQSQSQSWGDTHL